MNNADNNKVTIDAEWFAELYASYSKFKNIENYGVGLAEKCDRYRMDCERISKERDELNAKLAAAERCIEDVWDCMSPQEIADNEYAHIDIIRAYRAQKEAK